MPRTYTVTRNCCTSGNCIKCRGVTPVGKPLRIVQQRGIKTKVQADGVAMGWGSYNAKVELERKV